MMEIIKMVLGVLGGDTAAAKLGGAAVNTVSSVATMGSLGIAALYVLDHVDALAPKVHALLSVPLFTVDLGSCAVIAAAFAAALKFAHILKSPTG